MNVKTVESATPVLVYRGTVVHGTVGFSC